MYKPLLASALFIAVPMSVQAGDDTYIEASVTAEIGTEVERDSRVSHRTYEVFHYGDDSDSRQEVFDRALHKAAKKTLKEGYDWFRIVDRETERDTNTRERSRSRMSGGFYTVPERSCGLLTCTTRSRTYYRGDIDAGFPDRRDTTYTVILEIELGEGYVRNSDNVFDAKMVKLSYR